MHFQTFDEKNINIAPYGDPEKKILEYFLGKPVFNTKINILIIVMILLVCVFVLILSKISKLNTTNSLVIYTLVLLILYIVIFLI